MPHNGKCMRSVCFYKLTYDTVLCVFSFAFLFIINMNYNIMKNNCINTCTIQYNAVYLYYNYNEVII